MTEAKSNIEAPRAAAPISQPLKQQRVIPKGPAQVASYVGSAPTASLSTAVKAAPMKSDNNSSPPWIIDLHQNVDALPDEQAQYRLDLLKSEVNRVEETLSARRRQYIDDGHSNNRERPLRRNFSPPSVSINAANRGVSIFSCDAASALSSSASSSCCAAVTPQSLRRLGSQLRHRAAAAKQRQQQFSPSSALGVERGFIPPLYYTHQQHQQLSEEQSRRSSSSVFDLPPSCSAFDCELLSTPRNCSSSAHHTKEKKSSSHHHHSRSNKKARQEAVADGPAIIASAVINDVDEAAASYSAKYAGVLGELYALRRLREDHEGDGI